MIRNYGLTSFAILLLKYLKNHQRKVKVVTLNFQFKMGKCDSLREEGKGRNVKKSLYRGHFHQFTTIGYISFSFIDLGNFVAYLCIGENEDSRA